MNRKQIQAYLQKQLQVYPYSVLAGDWNAALYSTDRSARDEEEDLENHRLLGLDTSYAEFVETSGLVPLDPIKDYLGEVRERTFRSNRQDAHGSKIDDVLVSTALQNDKHNLAFPDCNGDSNHDQS